MGKKKEAAEGGQKLTGFKSLGDLVVVGVLVAMIIVAIIVEVVNVVEFRENYKTTVKNDLLTMVEIGGALLDSNASWISANPGVIGDIVGDVKLESYDSSYSYVVSEDGTMLYHPTPEKIGQPVENAAVKSIVGQLAEGKVPEPQVIEYEFKGAMKYAGSYVQPGSHNIYIITVDEKDVFAPITDTMKKSIVFVVIALIVIGVLMYLFIRVQLKPVGILTTILENSSRLDFRHNDDAEKVIYRKDEIGQLGRSIGTLRKAIKEVVTEIDHAAGQLDDNATRLKDMTVKMNDNSADNSATSQELAAGMQETSATTETINGSVGIVVDNATQINELSEQGTQNAVEIKNKADSIKADVQTSLTNARNLFEDVKRQSDDAIEQSKAVDKINELTETIKSIAGQTNLLALNASIEAARAGEAGRGFAVVAEEIGHLATQSSDTVSGINDIVEEVHKSVDNMSRCLERALEYIDKNAMADYAKFDEIAEGYSNDATNFEVNMSSIHDAVSSLTNSIGQVSDSISGINSTIGESARGVTDIAQKTTDIVSLTSSTDEVVDETLECSREMKEIVGRFKM